MKYILLVTLTSIGFEMTLILRKFFLKSKSIPSDVKSYHELAESYQKLPKNMNKIIVGQLNINSVMVI